MPRRLTPLVNGYFYHIYNHGIDHRQTFTGKREYSHFQLATWFYQPVISPCKLSAYQNLPAEQRLRVLSEVDTHPKLIHIHAYCLMNNHYHFLIEQLVDNGISTFIGNLQNSHTKYFNAKHQRRGPPFLSAFRAKQIYTDEQFLHLSRSIHLNPYTAYVVKTYPQLQAYPHSSLPEYFSNTPTHQITHTHTLSSHFKSKESHWQFITNQADYQRQLSHISHLIDE